MTITNQDGFIYAGVADMAAKKPTMTQLRNGVSGNGTAMTNGVQYVKKATAGSITLAGLKERTLYQLFYGAYTVDTTEYGQGTVVYAMNVTTSSSLVIMFGNQLSLALFTLIGMIVALFALNWLWIIIIL